MSDDLVSLIKKTTLIDVEKTKKKVKISKVNENDKTPTDTSNQMKRKKSTITQKSKRKDEQLLNKIKKRTLKITSQGANLYSKYSRQKRFEKLTFDEIKKYQINEKQKRLNNIHNILDTTHNASDIIAKLGYKWDGNPLKEFK
jgi:phenylalanyl-tRNA synthetase alpha subunit